MVSDGLEDDAAAANAVNLAEEAISLELNRLLPHQPGVGSQNNIEGRKIRGRVIYLQRARGL